MSDVTPRALTAAVAIVTAKLGGVDVDTVELAGEAQFGEVIDALALMLARLLDATSTPDAGQAALRDLGVWAASVQAAGGNR